jgi:hypothetical protein
VEGFLAFLPHYEHPVKTDTLIGISQPLKVPSTPVKARALIEEHKVKVTRCREERCLDEARASSTSLIAAEEGDGKNEAIPCPCLGMKAQQLAYAQRFLD